MKLYQGQNIQRFCDRTYDVLLQSQAEHNLLLAILQTLERRSQTDDALPYLAWIEENQAVQSIAVHIPRRNVVLSKMSEVETALFAEDISRSGRWPPGVAGLPDEVQIFVQTWQQLTQQPAWVAMEMYVHQLTQVKSIVPCRGRLRVAESCDRNQVLAWSQAFDQEAFGQVQAWTEQVVDRQLQQENIYLWEDDKPVSMAMGRGSTPGGGHLGPVYTPPEYRRQGYATACVTALSQRLLDQGHSSCFLFTDQANSTSNHIYQAIGYQRRCDWLDYRFGKPN
ncbi:hypothetical protein C1752_04500 [Acaryochloris thomasi RCC1774]|uniref:N-acetyltransferase domain-containing protein n=1 Tax=Acaryochloris thomasi RCC1774 TaxID=1764569 RepID=A0A2W1JLN5_9CYAN|nr:GNAT family N-acetyltransferase [Acaryochloris thomasi]PZD71792.1 hypothetical protein C1752_04500 [Acaryochloris thomasi RCC1774]